ncbi:MAG: FecR family protein [Ferruginibacter sp.]
MNEERIWLLMSLQFSGEATAAEKDELETLLGQHPELAEKARVMTALWQIKPPQADTAASYNRHLQRLSSQLASPALQYENSAEENTAEAKLVPLRSKRKIWYWAAACVAVVVMAGYAFFMPATRHITSPKMAANTVSTKAGSKSKIQLPDGTEVWLNAESRIEYNESFNLKTREVKLTGEAFFDVVKNKEKPFIIHTAQMDVRVTGTAFNVRSYPDEPTTETSLLRGAVEISLHNNPEKKYYLKPNDKLVISNNLTAVADQQPGTTTQDADKPLVHMRKVNINKEENDVTETMWVKNKLAFDNETLEKILSETERWYNVQIDMKNENAGSFRFTGVFENKPLTDVLEALCLASHLHYQVKGATVTIW